MFRAHITGGLALVLLFGLATVPVASAGDELLAIKAGRIDRGDGRSIENGTILIADGVISAVGVDVPLPDGVRVIDVSDGVVTPGLIDANTTITRAKRGIRTTGHPMGPSPPRVQWQFPLIGFPVEDDAPVSPCPMADLHVAGSVCPYCGFPNIPPAPLELGTSPGLIMSEGTSEVVPFTHVFDSIDLAAPDFARQARRGVTTVFVSPDSASVIGARGAIVKTEGPAEKRVVRRADAVKAAMGRDPVVRGGRNLMPHPRVVTTQTRRPASRMGVAWVFRKAFFEAQAAMAGEDVIGGADTPPERALEPLIGVLKGEIPLRIQARTQLDILTAIRVTDEFGLHFTLEEGIEAHRCLEALATRDIPVIFGPIYIEPAGWRARADESVKPRLGTAKALLDAGIRVALTANEMRDEEGLAGQAMYAMRCGLTYEEALAAVTSSPAKILGIDSAVGTIAPGKSADLVVWNGQPFATTTRIETVLISGQTVYEAR